MRLSSSASSPSSSSFVISILVSSFCTWCKCELPHPRIRCIRIEILRDRDGATDLPVLSERVSYCLCSSIGTNGRRVRAEMVKSSSPRRPTQRRRLCHPEKVTSSDIQSQ